MNQEMLPLETFKTVIKNTPLISIDLIVRNKNSKILLGKRLNKPAQGYWFVPGGRIKKNESISDALSRISSIELGFKLDISSGSLLGGYEHFYQDSYGSDNISTHYIALGYEFELPANAEVKSVDVQHETYQWMSDKALLSSLEVHENTKAYVR